MQGRGRKDGGYGVDSSGYDEVRSQVKRMELGRMDELKGLRDKGEEK